MIPVPETTPLDAAFGGKAMEILPPWKDIPDEFKTTYGGNATAAKWLKVVSDWFFRGLKDCKWTPRAGVETNKALQAVQCCIGSFEPSHEHKEAGCAYLLSQWFEDVTYQPAKK